MPLLMRKRVILAKSEVTYGTDPTPTGVANAILIRNLTITPQEMETADRDLIRPYLGNSEKLPAAIRVKVEFEAELMGSGTAGTAPQVAPLLKACAMSETVSAGVSVTYAPVSTITDSVTIYANEDGVLHKITGARGTYTIELNVKQIPVIRFTMTGIYNAVTDSALPTPTYTTVQPLTVTNTNTTPFTFHGVSAVMSQLTIDCNNDVVHRTLVGGAESVLITNRAVAGSIQIEATTVADKNWWTTIKDVTLGGLDITHGIVAGNKVQITSTRVQIVSPTYQDLDGVAMLQADLNMIPTSSGNDEISLIFK